MTETCKALIDANKEREKFIFVPYVTKSSLRYLFLYMKGHFAVLQYLKNDFKL